MTQLKEEYGVQPELVVSDFSHNLIGAIQAVFGEEVIQIDGFHVMRELNNGIKRDLWDFRERHFQGEIRALIALRKWVSLIQKTWQKEGDFSQALKQVGMPPASNPAYPISRACAQFTTEVSEILASDSPANFIQKLRALLQEPAFCREPNKTRFAQGILKVMPKKRYTLKGMARITRAILPRLKTYFLGFRSELEETSKQFFKDFWVIFFQPEKLTPKREEKLNRFLDTYPELRKYRQMTVQVGEIYRLPIEKIDGHQIDDLEESPAFSDKLNGAIRIIKKFKASILRFTEFYKRYPHLPKACRSNMEYYNSRLKLPFTRGNNLLKKERLLARLNVQFTGKIEWLLKEKAVV